MSGDVGSASSGASIGGSDDRSRWFYEDFREVARLGLRIREHLHSEQSAFQKIDVYQTEFLCRLLTLDDLIMLTERDEFVYHEMLIHIPLCSIPAPRSVLIVGGGDCGCIREVLKHPSIERVVQCEIDERVTRVCEEWFPWVEDAIADPRVELIFGDAVAEIERHQSEFDLIVIDSTDPIGPAVGLFQREFYGKVARALADGGVMVAQTESPHWDGDLVGDIHQEIGAAFEEVAAYVGFVPTYPSGMWSWAYASRTRRPDGFLDGERAEQIVSCCHYYNPGIQRAAFALPTFVQRARERSLAGLRPGG